MVQRRFQLFPSVFLLVLGWGIAVAEADPISLRVSIGGANCCFFDDGPDVQPEMDYFLSGQGFEMGGSRPVPNFRNPLPLANGLTDLSFSHRDLLIGARFLFGSRELSIDTDQTGFVSPPIEVPNPNDGCPFPPCFDAEVTAPFTFTSSFTAQDFETGQRFSFVLTGAGTTTAQLFVLGDTTRLAQRWNFATAPSPIPEPGTILLLTAAGGLTGLISRKPRRVSRYMA